MLWPHYLRTRPAWRSFASRCTTTAVRLENSSETPDSWPPLVVLPAAASTRNTCDNPPRLVRVIPSPPELHISVVPAPPSGLWRPFAAGILSMLTTGCLALWGTSRLTTEPDQQALMTTVALLPAMLSSAHRVGMNTHCTGQQRVVSTGPQTAGRPVPPVASLVAKLRQSSCSSVACATGNHRPYSPVATATGCHNCTSSKPGGLA